MENSIKNSTVESTLPKYLEFKVFEIFRNRLVKIIEPHCRENSREDVYRHIFLCPADISQKRNFQLKGVLSPYVCLWRTSPVKWNDDFYGRSVLPRDFLYKDTEGNERCERGYLYDLEFDMVLFSSSYYKTFRDRVNQDLIDLDRLRYFEIEVKELLRDCAHWCSKVELKLENFGVTDKPDENRSFDLTATYKVKLTVPYCHGFEYVDAVKIYLNENLIFESRIVEDEVTA